VLIRNDSLADREWEIGPCAVKAAARPQQSRG
jgi:hypothetical protein